mmetsp:Transcript_5070/g.9920  ORF Transcript_5070/g.9920 Transcript_5070/m.9920 type:complete len:130 (-) Transcript_5070:792-1181(-)
MPSDGFALMALMQALRSGAPFPKARRVIPANDGGIRNSEESISKAGLKKFSAVVARRRKSRMVTKISANGKRIGKRRCIIGDNWMGFLALIKVLLSWSEGIVVFGNEYSVQNAQGRSEVMMYSPSQFWA